MTMPHATVSSLPQTTAARDWRPDRIGAMSAAPHLLHAAAFCCAAWRVPYGRAMQEGATPAGSYVSVRQPAFVRPPRLASGKRIL